MVVIRVVSLSTRVDYAPYMKRQRGERVGVRKGRKRKLTCTSDFVSRVLFGGGDGGGGS